MVARYALWRAEPKEVARTDTPEERASGRTAGRDEGEPVIVAVPRRELARRHPPRPRPVEGDSVCAGGEGGVAGVAWPERWTSDRVRCSASPVSAAAPAWLRAAWLARMPMRR
ncbi:hypothetical protein AB0C14_04710 [Microbispora hainanensis]|uniref:hypothetical protein n=1 Tax=Microbispora hainanensis TaxID=568844 RepID=UPI0033C531B1